MSKPETCSPMFFFHIHWYALNIIRVSPYILLVPLSSSRRARTDLIRLLCVANLMQNERNVRFLYVWLGPPLHVTAYDITKSRVIYGKGLHGRGQCNCEESNISNECTFTERFQNVFYIAPMPQNVEYSDGILFLTCVCHRHSTASCQIYLLPKYKQKWQNIHSKSKW